MEQRIGIERMEEAINLFGSFDENIRLLESEFQVTVVNRGGELVISGEPENVMLAEKAVQALLTLSAKGESISEQHVRYVVGLCRSGQSERIGELTQDVICITSKGRPVKPKTIGQKQYVDAIMQDTVTIGVGPAGTGKTYLAVAAAGAAARGLAAGVFLAKAAGEGACGFGMEAGDGVGAGVAALASGAGVVACSSGAAVFTGSVTVSSAMASSLKRRMHKRERLPSRANQEVLTQPSPIILISWLKVHQYQDSRSGSPPNVLWSSVLSIRFVRFLSSTASSALRRERWKPALLC